MPEFKDKQFTVTKDPLDLRDLKYKGSLVELPPWIDHRGKVPFILDQGKEGACTGFALAAVVNFLLHNRCGAQQLRRPDGASARMLYQMAKRYDEWKGQNYEGSSIRGAMKGWHKHGVCRETAWPYRKDDDRSRLTAKRQMDALGRPLGNYFRVKHLHLNHLHSALAEVGILLASADVHPGWLNPDPTTGRIPFRRKKIGGHAFVIVGYDQEGLWIQNSWNRNWGLNGFGHLSYDDWLENGYDCWVARSGVVTRSTALSDKDGTCNRVLTFDYLPHVAATNAAIKPHIVDLGNDGLLSDSGTYRTDERDIAEIFDSTLPTTTKGWAGTPRLLLYAHGGLNGEKKSAVRVASMRPYFLANEIYPIHFMWETGLWQSIRSIVSDVFSNKRFGGIWSSVKDRFQDLSDEAIELASRGLGKPIWSEMKENAEGASSRRGGASLLAGRIADYRLNGGNLELHLVAHSAGSILMAHLLHMLHEWKLSAKSFTLFAPACTTDLFRTHILPYVGPGNTVERLTIFNMTNGTERDDNVAKVYRKSLLYLVSEAFEAKRKQPLLGMDRYLKKDDAITAALGRHVKKNRHTVIYSKGGTQVRLASDSTSHGGFDNDAKTLNSMLRIIRRKNELAQEFRDS